MTHDPISGGRGSGVSDSVLLQKPFSPDQLVRAVTKLLKDAPRA
ncbi:hypothetical protein [Bradyrhizobium sp. LTSPM299]|nr:hypothetical protein [Bradyrhizobium sp. LTSPM299]